MRLQHGGFHPLDRLHRGHRLFIENALAAERRLALRRPAALIRAVSAKHMRLVELLGENMLAGWFAKTKYTEKPKCDLCDEKRQITYTKPSGAKASEPCYVCGSAEQTLVPEEIEVYKFTQKKSGWGGEYPRIERYYTRKEETDWDDFEARRDAYAGQPFEKIDNYRTVFLTFEDCQSYCNWSNERRKP